MFFSKTQKPILVSLLKITIPISLSQFGHVMVGFVDCILAGNLGKQELAIATVSNAIFFPLLTFVIGSTSGITPLVAFQYGKGDIAEMKKLFQHSILLNTFISAFVLLFMLVVGNYIIHLFEAQQIFEQTWSFYLIFLVSIIPIIVFQTYKQYAEAIGLAKVASIITIGGNFLNVVLSLLLVKDMGINGIAWATVIARTAMAVVYVTYFYANKKLKKYTPALEDLRVHLSAIVFKKIMAISIPYGVQMLVEAAAFGAAGLLAVKIGIVEGGGHQIALQIASVVYMISTGLGAASTVRVGQDLGRIDFDSVKITIKLTIVLMLIYNVFTALLLLFFRDSLVYWFTKDTEILILCSHLLLFAASFQFFDGLQVALMGILRGLNDVAIPAILVASAYWLIAIPLGYMMAFHWNLGVDGIWYALVLGLFLVSIALYFRLVWKYKTMEIS